MDLESARRAVLNEKDRRTVAGQENLVIIAIDELGKIRGQRNLGPAADQIRLADLFDPLFAKRGESHDRVHILRRSWTAGLRSRSQHRMHVSRTNLPIT